MLLKLTVEPTLGGHIVLKGTWRSNAGTHPVAIKLQIATPSILSTRRGSLMGCLIRPSNANGTLAVTPELPGKERVGVNIPPRQFSVQDNT